MDDFEITETIELKHAGGVGIMREQKVELTGLNPEEYRIAVQYDADGKPLSNEGEDMQILRHVSDRVWEPMYAQPEGTARTVLI